MLTDLRIGIYSGMPEGWVGRLEKGSTLRLEHIGIKVLLIKCTKIGSLCEYLQAVLMTQSHGQVTGWEGWW